MAVSTILFVTNPEAGQANVHLATIAALKAKHGDNVDIHLCSYEGLRSRVTNGITFHAVSGCGLVERIIKQNAGHPSAFFNLVSRRPGFFGALRVGLDIVNFMHPEHPDQYIETALQVESLIKELDPDYIAADQTFEAGVDAIKRSGKRWCLLMPNTFKEATFGEQGWRMFTIPACGTGYLYPVPWHLRLVNFVLSILIGLYIVLLDKRSKALTKARNRAGFPGLIPLFEGNSGITTLCMSTMPEAELPAYRPSWLLCCGPILLPSRPVQETDPELAAWLSRGPTILIGLGTLFVMSEDYAYNMLASIRVVLDIRKDVQVLWKVRKHGDFKVDGVDALDDRLRVVDWLETDPVAILQTGNVICSVNHGGSNSYHEALATGIPQVIMPAWLDCYDFAARLQYLGNGVWGNSKAAPGCSEPEFTTALLTVVGRTADASEANRYRLRAKELGAIVTRNGTKHGREVATGSGKRRKRRSTPRPRIDSIRRRTARTSGCH
ncbi:hypothetical protein IAU60_000354 [Kwoniella sp. DSM 27419]